MEPPELREDLKQEIFLIVCEMDEEKLIGLFSSGSIKFFIVRIIINQIQSVSSPFYKKYRKIKFNNFFERDEYKESDFYMDTYTPRQGKYMGDHPIEEINEIVKRENVINQCEVAVENLPWYDQGILKLYAQHGSYRKVAELIDIPFTSIAATVNKARKEIKSKVQYD